MAQKMVGIQRIAKSRLESLSQRKRVSQQGLLSALVMMASGDANYGIIDIDWDKLRKDYPSMKKIQKKSWAAVVSAVKTLMNETQDPEEMAMRSRFTLAQITRAIEEIQDADKNKSTSRRKRG